MSSRLRKRQKGSGPERSELELRRFVGMMVHDLGNIVRQIRSLAHYLQDDPEVRSARGRRTLDDLAHFADGLANGLQLLRSVGSGDDSTVCEFVPDVMEPAAYLALRGHSRVRMLIDPSARALAHVRLRAGVAVLAIARFIAEHQPHTIRCTASNDDATVTITLELMIDPDSAGDVADGELEESLREAGVVSARVTAAQGRLLTALLEIGVAQ